MSDATLPPVRLFNSMTRTLDEVRVDGSGPNAGKVGIYWCGPTPYDDAHVGHARSALSLDLLVRVLRGRGFDVTSVRNITDIDDKILAKAQERSEEPTAFAARLADQYIDDMTAVGCLVPTHQPKVSECIPQIVALVQSLVDKGAAYAVPGESGEGGDVYFRVRAFDSYGKLSGRNIDEMRAGARVGVNEKKDDPLDFAVWKGCAESAWGWSSPWGRGRPGWHIECSAMANEHLGHGFAIHGGGMDLIFPHHENEIAQSEAAHPGQGPYVRCWIHNGFVNADKEKMSKSLGNFVTVRDVLARNDGEALRLFLLAGHYRGPIGFDVEKMENGRVVFPGVDESERKVDYLYSTLARSEGITVTITSTSSSADQQIVFDEVKKLRFSALAGLADDLGTANAIAALYRAAAIVNETMDLHQRKKGERPALARVVRFAADTVRELCELLGLLETPIDVYQARTRARRLARDGLTVADVEAKITERVNARKDKDFAKADVIRGELDAMGIEVFDGVAGTRWRKKI